jgi:hypothetical protein
VYVCVYVDSKAYPANTYKARCLRTPHRHTRGPSAHKEASAERVYTHTHTHARTRTHTYAHTHTHTAHTYIHHTHTLHAHTHTHIMSQTVVPLASCNLFPRIYFPLASTTSLNRVCMDPLHDARIEMAWSGADSLQIAESRRVNSQ